jgi:TetR/AcrR family transcriptional regulator
MIARRAYSETAKDDRRQHILDAADQLFNNQQKLPTASQISEAAGLAKGTIYLYFGSREEIFAALLLDGWARMLDELESKLASNGSKTDAIGAFVSIFVSIIEDMPNLMFLDAMMTDFKRNMSESARLGFHATAQERINQAGGVLERTLSLPSGRGTQLLVRSYAFSRGLWQTFDTRDATCETSSASMFPQELREALTEYWRGAVG